MKKEFEGINEYMKSKAYREKCKYLSFLCSHKETKQRNAPAQTPPDRYAA